MGWTLIVHSPAVVFTERPASAGNKFRTGGEQGVQTELTVFHFDSGLATPRQSVLTPWANPCRRVRRGITDFPGGRSESE
jgi:hypothetical protein